MGKRLRGNDPFKEPGQLNECKTWEELKAIVDQQEKEKVDDKREEKKDPNE